MRTSNQLEAVRGFLHSSGMRWAHDPLLWAELFVTANLGILAADICIAHAMNHFRRWPEYIPLAVSLIAPTVLLIGIWLRWHKNSTGVWLHGGQVMGWLAVATGLAGVLWHLESSFFLERTMRSLTYSAPFAAPLAYTGLGFLLLMNRRVSAQTKEWAQWILFFALGGFFGNFVLSLTDHAGNGFFAKTEWIPVLSSAFASSFLALPLLVKITRRFMDACTAVMLIQAAVGVLGFWFHLRANLMEPGYSLWEKMVNGAPPLAPLLFPNLVALAWIGIWSLIPHLEDEEGSSSWIGSIYAWAAREE